MHDVILRLPAVLARTGLSRTAIYDLIKWGQFPTPISLGFRTKGWVQREIQEWIDWRIDLTMRNLKLPKDQQIKETWSQHIETKSALSALLNLEKIGD